ncbi:MAG: hypothetical protein KC777_05440 [Cyanobacteria bacterium HKST-UBA02]|nr:hypothetical protein [Cyanobacteria bacterium HKST-UBA02]
MTNIVFEQIAEDAANCQQLACLRAHVDGRGDLAEGLLTSAIAKAHEDGRSDDVFVAHCLMLLATVRERKGMGRQVEAHYSGALRIYDLNYGTGHPVVTELALYIYQHYSF